MEHSNITASEEPALGRKRCTEFQIDGIYLVGPSGAKVLLDRRATEQELKTQRLARELVALANSGVAVPVGQNGGRNICHAPDFSWVIAASGQRFDFSTGRQRDIVRALYSAWEAGGDGSAMTEAAIIEHLEAGVERLRVERVFGKSDALEVIVCRAQRKEAAWALHLRAPR